jgi:uncharacterized protein YhhL (DUF1145 family)
MLISYNLSLSDYLAAQHPHYRQTLSKRLSLILIYGVFPLLGILFGFFYLLSLVHPTGKPFSFTFVISTAFLLLIPLWFQFNLRRLYKKSRVSDENCNLQFTDENIYAEMPGYSKSTVERRAIRNYKEGGKAILLYMAPTRFFVVPKRVLKLGQRDELIALLDRKIETKKK